MTSKSSGKAAGYSGTPLVRKLGIREGDRVLFHAVPDHYRKLLGTLPGGVEVVGARSGALDFIHFFTDSAQDLERTMPRLRKKMVENGMLWISWPKRASGVPTDITEDVVRKHAFANKLVDVKVCAVDEVWSGLKLVIRKQDRGSQLSRGTTHGGPRKNRRSI